MNIICISSPRSLTATANRGLPLSHSIRCSLSLSSSLKDLGQISQVNLGRFSLICNRISTLHWPFQLRCHLYKALQFAFACNWLSSAGWLTFAAQGQPDWVTITLMAKLLYIIKQKLATRINRTTYIQTTYIFVPCCKYQPLGTRLSASQLPILSTWLAINTAEKSTHPERRS